MGNVYAEITLKNSGDVTNAMRGIISEKDIHELTVTALVDTGAMNLVINEDTCKKLELSIIGTRTVSLAGGIKTFCKISEPVQICWEDRITTVHAWILPNEEEPLLGVIPLEDMDLIVDPVRRVLIGAHGDKIIGLLK